MALDFTDIESAQGGQATQDRFELFAREFLECRGYRIIKGPGRGADGGADLIVEKDIPDGEEKRTIGYLVSCKHYAHSGRSVTPNDESNIGDRLVLHTCDGFIAFYSTIPSQGLDNILHSYREKGDPIELYDPARIERELLENEECHPIARRFLRPSFDAWVQSNPLYPDKAREAITDFYASQGEFNITTHHTDDSVITLISARTDEEPGPTFATGQLKFHQEEDREALEAYKRLIEGGHPMELAPENIESLDHNETLLRLFPDLADAKNRPIRFLPVTIKNVERWNLVIVMPDSTEHRYPATLEFDQIREGTKERLLSNQRQHIPITAEVIIAPPKISVSITSRYGGFLSISAFRTCKFLAQLIPGARIELRHPVNDTTVHSFPIDSEPPYGRHLQLYERLARIESKTDTELIVPADGFDKETLLRIFSISQLVNGKHVRMREVAITIALDDNTTDLSSGFGSDTQQAYFHMSVDNNVTIDLLGTEVPLGTVLTVGWIVRSVKVEPYNGEDNRYWRTVHLEPTEKGFLYRYAIQYCSKESFRSLREKILPDAWEQLAGLEAITHLIGE